jgi:selenocysteine-specific elongation factor
VVEAVRQLHKAQPTRQGAEIADLQRQVAPWLEASAFAQIGALGVRQGLLTAHGTALALPGFVAKAAASPELVARLEALLAAQGLAPESPTQLALLLTVDGKSLLAALQAGQAAGQIVRISEDYWLLAATVDAARERVLTAFVAAESFSTGELKDVLGLTRKHLIPFAEYLDSERVTVRDPAGNRRIRERAREAWLAQKAASE